MAASERGLAGRLPARGIVAVIGASVVSSDEVRRLARETGAEIARRGYLLVCGGMRGVMEEAARGAREEGGITIGILPGKDRTDANPYIDIPILTAMSHARNAIIVRTADCVIAIDGSYGTLSEIALARCTDRPVYGIKTWDIEGVIAMEHAADALDHFERLAGMPPAGLDRI
jgi:uncharacterized protein (TIGR00725 family)